MFVYKLSSEGNILDNEKVVEMAKKFHKDTKDSNEKFSKKINSKFDLIGQKVDFLKYKNANAESFSKSIGDFSVNFDRINKNIRSQAITFNKLTGIYKILMGIAIIYLIVALVVLFKLPGNDTEKNNLSAKASTKATVSPTIATISPSATVSSEATASAKPTEEVSEDYGKLIKDYKLAYIKAFNTNDRSDLNGFISTGSKFDKYLADKLANTKGLKIEFKDTKLEQAEKKDGYIYIYATETLGTKEKDASDYTIADYKVKYTVKKTDTSYTFEDSENIK